ncbi:MAG TPA: type II toxin-antitoxin system VapC family toxin [Herpetosiphonaceae bacterium]|nr:type II toxin-antitoxin system VapC family toxin [Herpetosiphonaceae bacterium]
MIVVDASVLVSAAWPSDVNHQISRAWLQSYVRSSETMTAPVLIFSEVGGALMRRTQRAGLTVRALQRIRLLPRFTPVPVDVVLGDDASDLAVALQLRGADAVYVALAAQLIVPLITWDQEQLVRGSQRVTTYEPAAQP